MKCSGIGDNEQGDSKQSYPIHALLQIQKVKFILYVKIPIAE